MISPSKILSIIIPSYNMEAYIAKCLCSLLVTDIKQLQKLDIIVVNDGSKDKTGEIAHEFGRRVQRLRPETRARRPEVVQELSSWSRTEARGRSLADIQDLSSSPRLERSSLRPEVVEYECSNGTKAKISDYGIIRVIDKPNRHYGSCINAALPVARGTYVKVLDADDYVDTEALAFLLKKLEQMKPSELPDAVVADYDRVDPDGKSVVAVRYPLPRDRSFSLDESLSYTKTYIGIHALIVRTKLFLDIGYRQLEGLPYTDTMFALGAVPLIRSVRYFPYVVTKYLVGRDGQTVNPDIFLRDLPKYDSVARENIRRYCAVDKSHGLGFEKYYCFCIETLVKGILNFYVLGLSGKLPKVSGRDFDAFVREYLPELSNRADSWTLSRNLKFHYIHEWRRTYSNYTWKFRLYRIYSRIAKSIGTIILKFK